MWSSYQNTKYQFSDLHFKYSFFPSTLNDWFRLDMNIRNSESISLFKSRLLSLIRPNQSNIYYIFDPIDLKLVTLHHLGLCHLNEHKFRHNFQNCLNPLCSCSAVWKLKIPHTTFCTANTFLTVATILWIV